MVIRLWCEVMAMGLAWPMTRRQVLAGLGGLAAAGCSTYHAATRPSAKPPGTLLWRAAIPGGLLGLVAAGGLLCASAGDELLAIRPSTGRTAWHQKIATLRVTVSGTGTLVFVNRFRIEAVSAATGRTLWTSDVPYVKELWISLELSYAAGRVYTTGPVLAQPAVSTAVIALDSRSGRRVWQTLLPYSDQVRGVTGGDGIVYVVCLSKLIALDATSGRRMWSVSGSMTPLAVGVTDGVVYGFTGGGQPTLAAADASTGAPLWHVGGMANEWAFDVNDNAIFVSVSSTPLDAGAPGDVLALDARTGKVLWRHHFPHRAPTALTATRSVLYAAQEHGTLYALSAGTGRDLWRFSIQESPKDELAYVVAAEGNVYAGNVGGALYALRA